MKKYLSFAKYYICLLFLLGLGVYILAFGEKEATASETENRMLQAFPAFSVRAAADGRYMTELEAYLSDAFPARSALIGLSRSFMELFSAHPPEDDTRKAVEEEMGLTDNAPPPELPAPAAAETVDAAPETSADSDRPTRAESDAALWFVRADGSREIVETYSAEHISYLAGVLNQYRACLPPEGRVFFLNAPASDYVNAIFDQHRYADWGYDLDRVMQPLLDDNVKIYSALAILDPWKNTEKLYSQDDFHWLIHSAWRVSNAFIKDLGYAPTDFYDYSYYLRYSLNDGPHTPEQLKNTTVERSDLMVPLVLSPTRSDLISWLTNKTPTPVYDFTLHAYTMYFGGTKGPYRLFETGFHTGHNALVVGDSFSLPVLYYLFPYYDNVLHTDFRERNYQRVGASVRQYIEEYDIDDVYFISCVWTSLNSNVFTWRMERFLNTDYTPG